MNEKPASSRRITKLLLGQILIDGEFITPCTLQAAMDVQKDADARLGEILLCMGALNSADLSKALSLQRNLASFEASEKVAVGIRELFSDRFVKETQVTTD